MIQLSKNYSLPERQEEPIPIKVVGVGSAGSNALDRVLLDGMDKNDLISINTDVQALASSVAARKVQLGRTSTRGLGTGGDPELGYQAAIESAPALAAVPVPAQRRSSRNSRANLARLLLHSPRFPFRSKENAELFRQRTLSSV
jgi:hypothetical protein